MYGGDVLKNSPCPQGQMGTEHFVTLPWSQIMPWSQGCVNTKAQRSTSLWSDKMSELRNRSSFTAVRIL